MTQMNFLILMVFISFAGTMVLLSQILDSIKSIYHLFIDDKKSYNEFLNILNKAVEKTLKEEKKETVITNNNFSGLTDTSCDAPMPPVKALKEEKKPFLIVKGIMNYFLVDGVYKSYKELEKEYGVPSSTLKNYIKNEKKFLQKLKEGKENFNNPKKKRRTRTIISSADKSLMIKYYREGKSFKMIGDKFDVGELTIRAIIKREGIKR